MGMEAGEVGKWVRGHRRLPVVGAPQADVAGLSEALAKVIEGEVRFRDGDRALWAADASNYRQIPIGVVLPRHKEDIVAAIATCRSFGAPVLMRGGGTSLAGQCCNVAVVIDASKYVRGVLEVDPAAKRARVLPGTILDQLRNEAVVHDLTFGPDPATHNHCTLGGMLGNNSCGPHSVMAGRTADNVHELEIVTYDGLRLKVGATAPEDLERIVRERGRRGEIYRGLRALRDRYDGLIRARYPKIPRRVSGYNLDELLPENGFNVARALVGSEGTCVSILEATVGLVPWPRARALLVVGYPDLFTAADQVPGLMAEQPLALEGIDRLLLNLIEQKGLHASFVGMLPEGGAHLFVEFGGDSKKEAAGRADEVAEKLRRGGAITSAKVFSDPEHEEKMWLIRESGLGATARVPGQPDAWPGWEDSAVAPEKLGKYLRELRRLMDQHHLMASLYGHFGQGCVHCRIDFNLVTREGLDTYRQFVEQAADLVTSLGGSLSGEHGDGQSRAELLPKMYGPQLLEAFREFKRIWDPEWKMNPGKVVEAYRLDQNLRLGLDFSPSEPATHFQFPDDGGDMSRATLRCVGVGKCRRTDGGTMCPSYMVLNEEEHSTRGRAHLLFEMLRGDSTVRKGWRDEAVRESLDLCLACKGCKGDCPVNVDMATYKAEFLSHYYERRLRPRVAYSMGLVHWWARLASHMPGLTNLFTQTPGLARVAKAIAGIAPERRIPTFAARTFKQLFFARERRGGGDPVLLWPDTFNNHFYPETAMAAVEVLESAGYQVIVPRSSLCCGRPLYDFGMLDAAKRLLRRILADLAPIVRQGVPIVGLEPSCVSVLRDELRGLMPRDQDAMRLRQQTFMFDEFVAERLDRFDLPALPRRALAHGHCHAKSLWGLEGERRILSTLALDHHVIDSGCCGMAGSFGFEAGEKYDVSIKAGERKLLPAVRDADEEVLLVADGFSCREQIRQTTDRDPMHLAQVVRMAQVAVAQTVPEKRPETAFVRGRGQFPVLAAWKPATLGLAALGGLVATAVRPRGRHGRRPWGKLLALASVASASGGLAAASAWLARHSRRS